MLVPYCSSDLWLGKKSTHRNGSFDFVNDPSVDNFSFKGHTIFRSVFKDLHKNYNISFSEEIVVSGSSAGGIGVLNHALWLTTNFTSYLSSKPRFLFIIDSAWFINFQDGFKSRVNSEFGKLTNISSAACADMRYGYACCLSASCLLIHTTFRPQCKWRLFLVCTTFICLRTCLKVLKVRERQPKIM